MRVRVSPLAHMFNLLHTFNPQPLVFSYGVFHIYWYGLFMVLSMIAALITTLILARRYQISKDTIIDLAFWLIIGGLIGARVYDCFLNFNYYLGHPLDILKIWQGGLAIHGAIIGGLITLIIYTKRNWLEFWKLVALVIPGLALAQAMGRWGNYFNQELYGLPTSLPWGIPIDILHRSNEHISNLYFHPTFLYESLGSFIIFGVLISLTARATKTGRLNLKNYLRLAAVYFILYSILRFMLEFIRLDATPQLFGLRWPQIISLLIILFSGILLKLSYQYAQNNSQPTEPANKE